MRILALAPEPFFAARGTPYSVYYRTLTMAEQGAEIDLLTYGQGRDVRIPGVRHLRLPHPSFLKPVGIGPSLQKLLLDVVMLFAFLRLVTTGDYTTVHAHEESVFFAAVFKPLFGYRLVYDMHSSLPQQLTNFQFTTSRLLIGAFRWLENLALRRADAVVTVCPDLAAHAVARMPDPSRHIMIENTRFEPVRFADDGEARPAGIGSPDTAESAGPGDAFSEFPAGRRIVFYAGSFEPYQGLDRLVRAVAALNGSHPDVTLVLAGGQPAQVEEMRRLADDLSMGDACILPGSIPQATVRRLLPKADVLVSSRVSGNNTPLKIYEQLASGVPLVATAIRAHTQVLDDSLAFLVEPTPEGLEGGIRRALDDRDEAMTRAEAARRRAATEYSLEAFREKTADLLARIR